MQTLTRFLGYNNIVKHSFKDCLGSHLSTSGMKEDRNDLVLTLLNFARVDERPLAETFLFFDVE